MRRPDGGRCAGAHFLPQPLLLNTESRVGELRGQRAERRDVLRGVAEIVEAPLERVHAMTDLLSIRAKSWRVADLHTGQGAAVSSTAIRDSICGLAAGQTFRPGILPRARSSGLE